MNDLRKLVGYFRPYRGSLAIAITCILGYVLFNLSIPLVVGRAIDTNWIDVSWSRLTIAALKVLGLSAVGGFFLYLQRSIINRISRHIEYDLRQDFYRNMVDQPLSFFQEHRTGDLMARATNDLAAVRQLVGPMIMYSLQTVFTVLVLTPLLFRINWKLTLLLFVTMPLVSLTVKIFGQQVHTRFEKIQDFFAQITARAQENFTGVRVVRAYAQETAEIAAFNRLNREYAQKNMALVRIDAMMRPLMTFLIGIGFVLIIWAGVPLAVRGEISVGQFTEFNMYLLRLIWPLIAIGYVVNLYQRGTASWKRMLSIMSIKPAITDAPHVQTQPAILGRIEFRGLTFRYHPTSEPVLRDIDLTIAAGQTVAFVGRTGSGKSTIVNLIPRVMEASPGMVLVDGVPVADYPLAQLRGAIGYVPQETFLFSNGLDRNIAFGVDHAQREEIERAAGIAGLDEDVRGFPDGFDTLVGERGITLSGGQKQRTAIARAVLRQPKIMILDDALSSVDTYTEEKILAQLRGVMRERTSLIVSHRISTVRHADLICVLDQGQIIERGTHEELLARGGEYKDLYERQLLEEELAAT
ncbi:MAG: ATP-binding cassette, subfamily multidrug efflux pump [Blastocatellia bacterium]|jgi:ATP-binding cassette subfamily B protein|nr:ATP-binding cassette, subfamily multidrug efflux pump [Blastocatellia bacterium]